MKNKINKIKKDVIKHINSLKFTGHYSKEELIEKFNNFKKEDFCCFAEDGNTYLTPEEYYKNLSKKEAKKEYESDKFGLEFHKIKDELGVNLLKCCGKCRNLFLERIFKNKVYEQIFNKIELEGGLK